jgi:hypothetical protein
VKFNVERLGELTQHDIQDVLVLLVNLEQLLASREHHGSEEVYRHDSIVREEEIKQPRDVLVVLYVVGEHGDGTREGERGLALGHVGEQLGVGGAEDGAEQLELGDGRLERGQHEVADAQDAQAGDGSGRLMCAEDEQEDLDDVVVALEVAQRGVPPEDVEYDIGELFLAVVQLPVRLCEALASKASGGYVRQRTILGVVNECAVDIEANLMLVFVGWQLLPWCVMRVLLRAPQQQRPCRR